MSKTYTEAELKQALGKLTPEELFAVYKQEAGYDEIPVSIMDFIEGDDYLGPFFDGGLYPCWNEPLEDVYPNPYLSPYNEVILTGSVGRGKTTIAIAGLCYDLYRTLLIKQPQKLFGLMPKTILCYHIFNATLDLSNDVIWMQLTDIFNDSYFFKEQRRMNKEDVKKENRRRTAFPKNVDITLGSRFTHALGKAVISSMFDEVNFQNVVAGQAYKNYNTLTRRQASRFAQKGGMLPGRNWLVSSTDTELSFLQTHIENVKDDPTTAIFGGSIWEAQAHKGIYSGENFNVFIGDEFRDAVIVDEGNTMAGYDEDLILEVPIELIRQFSLDTVGALREFGGVAIGGTNRRLIRSQQKINNALVFKPYFTKDVIELDFDDDSDQLINYMDKERYGSKRTYPSRPRFIHIDTGLTNDNLGMSCGYVAGFKDVDRVDEETGVIIDYKEPVIHVEWSIAISAKGGSEVPLFKIRQFIIGDLLKRLKIPIVQVSTDGFEAKDMRQLLKKSGMKTEYISVDKTPDAYRSLRNATYEERLLMPNNNLLRKELIELEIVPVKTRAREKIDHPMDGSKDIADSVAGVVVATMEHKLSSKDMVREVAKVIETNYNQPSIYDSIKSGDWKKLK